MSAVTTSAISKEEAASEPNDTTAVNPHWQIPLWRSAVVAVLVASIYFICRMDSGVNSQTQAGVVMDLPVFVGPFMGVPVEPSLSEKTILPPDTEFERRHYRSLGGYEIDCGIVLAGGQRRSIHRPEVCLDGQGWEIPIGEQMTINLASGDKLDVMKLDLKRTIQLPGGEKKELKQIFLYWFVGSGRTTAQHLERILLTSRDRVFGNLNHRWAYVTVSSVVTGSLDPRGKDEEETLKMMEDIIRTVVPTFTKAQMANAQDEAPEA